MSSVLQLLRVLRSTSAMANSKVGDFCPHAGVISDTSHLYDDQMRQILSYRLRIAAWILVSASLAFFLRNLVTGLPEEAATRSARLLHGVLLGLQVGALVILSARCPTCLIRLRVLELVVFGAPCVFLAHMQHLRVCQMTFASPADAAAATLESLVPWLILMQVYGLSIPNRSWRAALFIGFLGLFPLAGMVSAAQMNPMVESALFGERRFSAFVIWTAISAVTADYGAWRIGRLRREAYDARRIEMYTLRELLGAGGMGEVYLAEHRMLKRRCAIKLIKAEKAGDQRSLARFESEVQAAALLTHPHTISIFDYGHTEDGTFYYVMEYLPGMSLDDIVDRFGPLPPSRVVFLLEQVSSALTEAHAAGMIHRDIKPGNILAAERGGLYDYAKLLDFGLVKSTQQDPDSLKLTVEGAVIGSPMFAPPETVDSGELDQRSDIYSLGATAFYLLTGRAVFQGESALKVFFAHAHEPVPDLQQIQAGIPEDLAGIVSKCLAKRPEDRFQTAEELQQAFRSCDCYGEWTRVDARTWWLALSDEDDRRQAVQVAETLVVDHSADANAEPVS